MAGTAPGVDWAVAEAPHPGEQVSGDASLILDRGDEFFAAVIDGLGHGPGAADAASVALETLAAADGLPLDELMRDCHRAMTKTRGAAVTLVSLAPGRLRWLAVGNVAAVATSGTAQWPSRHVPLRGGIVGARIPNLRNVDELPVEPGDVVVLATDGLRSGFTRAIDPALTARHLADRLLADFSRGTDDALVMVLRYISCKPT